MKTKQLLTDGNKRWVGEDAPNYDVTLIDN